MLTERDMIPKGGTALAAPATEENGVNVIGVILSSSARY
jgi:hypothetical protein